MSSSWALARWSLGATCVALGCAATQGAASDVGAAERSAAAPRPAAAPAPRTSAISDAESTPASPAAPAPGACPEGTLRVQHDFCPDLERRCLKSERDPSNHITICHRFEPGVAECKAPRQTLDYCIDRYEYPNREGAHPPALVSWHDAGKLCAERGQRLCTEREWTAACEGPDELPFPYGWERDPSACNIDNRWIDPRLSALESRDPAVSARELARLDQSVPSGARARCVSGFGVHDLTGNFDEWVRADHDRPREHGRWAALKGGAWGHVRNACRPVTTSHAPEWRYYFVSFRCCADPASR